MITIFNRRQLAVTYALEEKIHICRVLAEQNIESATGSFGENSGDSPHRAPCYHLGAAAGRQLWQAIRDGDRLLHLCKEI